MGSALVSSATYWVVLTEEEPWCSSRYLTDGSGTTGKLQKEKF